jgi:hypothetical protein
MSNNPCVGPGRKARPLYTNYLTNQINDRQFISPHMWGLRQCINMWELRSCPEIEVGRTYANVSERRRHVSACECM